MKQKISVNIRETGIRTIRLESEAIGSLEQYINADFERVVELMAACTGRVVITGIGKSAIIAQKIVATFNSTGTPALFMHAADAIHGDLGMITPTMWWSASPKAGNPRDQGPCTISPQPRQYARGHRGQG